MIGVGPERKCPAGSSLVHSEEVVDRVRPWFRVAFEEAAMYQRTRWAHRAHGPRTGISTPKTLLLSPPDGTSTATNPGPERLFAHFVPRSSRMSPEVNGPRTADRAPRLRACRVEAVGTRRPGTVSGGTAPHPTARGPFRASCRHAVPWHLFS